MRSRLDEIDLKILNILVENSRASISEIAKSLKISRPTAKQRIENMEKEGIIKKYTIEISEEICEKRNEFFIIVRDIGQKVIEEESVVRAYKLSGNTYAMVLSISSTEELKEIVGEAEIIAMYPIFEKIERKVIPKISVKFHCDYCGKEVVDKPEIFKIHNRVYFFCCKTCLKDFKKSGGIKQ